MGSPPHRRGKGGTDRSGDLRHGFTPAQAGKSWNRHRPSRHSANHPRACGEKPNSRRMSSCRVGSPPRGRGKDFAGLSCTCREGITPAWAGKSPEADPGGHPTQDHPRVGGEKVCLVRHDPVHDGSPPRGRGKAVKPLAGLDVHRITPAWAGKRFQKPIDMLQGMGSPPRGRGKVSDSIVSYLFTRITPAWAGKSLRSGLAHSMFWDHPRVGGEKSPLQSDAAPHGGSPPRGRGKAS